MPVSRQGGWANGFDLHDMIGNVLEWTEGWIGSSDSRVLRGGSWFNYPQFCRAADRGGGRPDIRGSDVGFRVCRGSPIDSPDAASRNTDAPSR